MKGQSMKTGVYEVSADEYHRDELPGVTTPCLSSSIAKILDARSPAHTYTRHPKLGGSTSKSSDTLDEGTALHSMLLGVGREVVLVECEREIEPAKGRGAAKTPAVSAIVKPSDYKTNAAKAERDRIRAAGQIPMLAKDFDRTVKTAAALRQRIKDLDFDLQGEVEQTVLWVETADDGTPVQCKAMFDLVDWSTGRIRDLKSCESAHPDAIARAVEDYGYSIQDAAYRSAFGAVRPVLRGREDICFLFMEKEEPYAVTPAWLDASFRRIGETRWRRAVNTWARCLRDGRWPDYGACSVAPPGWVLKKEEERQMAEAAQEGRAA